MKTWWLKRCAINKICVELLYSVCGLQASSFFPRKIMHWGLKWINHISKQSVIKQNICYTAVYTKAWLIIFDTQALSSKPKLLQSSKCSFWNNNIIIILKCKIRKEFTAKRCVPWRLVLLRNKEYEQLGTLQINFTGKHRRNMTHNPRQ